MNKISISAVLILVMTAGYTGLIFFALLIDGINKILMKNYSDAIIELGTVVVLAITICTLIIHKMK